MSVLSAVLLKCFRVVKRKYVNVCAYKLTIVACLAVKFE